VRARELIGTIGAGEYIYQPELGVPTSFYERYDLDSSLVHWPICRPDLIETVEGEGGQLHLRVIDIKASPGVKLSHRIQATVYSLILESLLGDWRAADRTVAPDAGIWLAQHSEPEYFDLRMLRPPIEQFLEHELQPLMRKPAAEAPWHLYFRCEWCEWFDHCREEMRETDSTSRVPYLTTHAKRFLDAAEPPIANLTDFSELLAKPKRHAELDGCASLRGKGERLKTQVEALRKDEILPFGGSSLAMPVLEHVRVILTAQREPVSGQLYTYGLYAQGLADVFGPDDRRRTIARVASDGDIDTIVELQRSLVRDLWEVFEAVDAYNAKQEEWLDKKSLQVFTFDTYERQIVVETLLERLPDADVAEAALKTLFQLQGPDLMQAEEHPADQVFFPIVVLSDVLRDRLALPSEVTYRFGDAVNRLQPEKYGFTYRDSDYYGFVLSNQMRSDAVYSLWYEARTERIEGIENEIKQRLWAANSLVNGARERLQDAGALFAYPPKFELPRSFDYRSPILSRLAFLAQYERVLAYVDERTRRMAPLAERVRAGDAVVVRWLGGERFAVREISENLDLTAQGFPSWLLAPKTEDGQRALLGFDDFFNRNRVWVRKGLPLWLAGIGTVRGSPAEELELGLTEGPDTPQLRRNADYVLCRRFTDFTTKHAIAELTRADEASQPEFIDLLTSPALYGKRIRVPEEERTAAIGLASDLGMTPSQLAAFERVLDHRLQLVWGPPGTGKTHFLSLAILVLAETSRIAGKPLRVMLTAFTHAAIENALRKIDELQREHSVVSGGFAIGKLYTITGDAGDSTELVDKTGGDGWLASHEQAVLGATVWALRRTAHGSADLVVVDEGSQVLIPSAALATSRLARKGRLLMAGDDRQLPPIVIGAYPDPEEDEPLLHRSIFECVRRADPEHDLTGILLENWRMNETLCRYPREQVYVEEYASATPEISGRRLALSGKNSDWVDELIDPDHPLVVCVTEGVQASAENVIEAGLVADAAARLRERLLDSSGHTYQDSAAGDEVFWKDGLFIVSPHHAQIRAIRRALAERRGWHAEPFVDTVDKMQGQECDAAIVSYGVSDVEYAMTEKEFIYSLNRLNVAITRARSKTIVFLPLPLLEPPVAAFEDDATAEGISFMQGLWRFADENGELIQRELRPGATVSCLRVASPG
jgi:DNA replication ATP-dependent helicase Dna2